MTREPRRGARIAATFWIGIEGIDTQPTLRRGNLSASGMYFEVAENVGPAGSVQFVHIESEDRSVVVQVLARIIRASAIDDLVTGKRVGLALEFMPSSAKGRHNLARLVRHVVELGLRQEEVISHGFAVGVSGQYQTDRTTLQHLSVQKLVLETDWRASVGELLEFQICTSQARGEFPLEGQVTSVVPTKAGYRVEISITGLSTRRATTVEDEVGAMASLIAQPFDDFALPSRDHLSGELSRIKLPTLLGLMELERMSGQLRVTSDTDAEVVLYIAEGRLLDAIRLPDDRASSREVLASLMNWTNGHFNFVLGEVERQDTIGTSTTSLLLDLAREEDEASKDLEIDPTDVDFF